MAFLTFSLCNIDSMLVMETNTLTCGKVCSAVAEGEVDVTS